MRFFLVRAACCTLALFVPALWLLPSVSSAAFARELRVQRLLTAPQGTTSVLSATAPGPAQVSQLLKRRMARDCFGNPAAAMGRFAAGSPASQFGVSGASQEPVILRILVLRVDFLSDRTGSLTTTEGGGFDLRRGTSVLIDPPPHNRDYFAAHMRALSRYYSAMSARMVDIEYNVFPVEPDSAFHLSDTADYGPWSYGEGDYDIAVRLITDAVQAADRSSEPIIFSQYDMVYIYHSGADLQGDINGDSYYDIPSFTVGLETPIPVDGGISHVYAATVLPETVSQDGLTGAINGVTAHETGHMLGLPDMYNTEDFLPSVGYWSLMDTGNYLAGNVWDPVSQTYVYVFGLLPGGLDAYCRRVLGRTFGVQTLEENPVSQTWADTLQAVESSYKVLNVPVSASEYFMIENREADLDGNGAIIVTADTLTGVILGPQADEYDALLPGSGMLIWHLDDNIIAERASRGLGPNGSRSDRGVYLEEADGIEDLGDPYSAYWLGSEFDPYFQGNATLFTPSSVPNSDANSGTSSHVYAEIKSPRQVGMYASIERMWARSGWPVVSRHLAGSVPGFGDFDSDGIDEIFLAGSDSTLRAWRGSGETYLAGESEGFFAHAPGSLMPVVSYAGLYSLLVGTVSVGGQGKLYAWTVNDSYSPLLPGQVMAGGWPPAIPSVTTSPCWMNDNAIAGCSDGAVYAINGAGGIDWNSASVTGLPVTGTIAAGWLFGSGPDVWQYEVAYTSGRRSIHCVFSQTGEDVFTPFQLPAEAVSDTVGPFVLMADVDGKPDSTLEVLVVLQSGLAFALDASGLLLNGWPVSLGDTVVAWPSAADVDGDGLSELVVHTAGGRVYVVNGSGVVSSGWPYESGSRADTLWQASGGDPRCAVSLVNLDSGPGAELISTAGQSELSALTSTRERVQGWPLSTGDRVSGALGVVDLNWGGTIEVFVPLADTLLWCFEVPAGSPSAWWPVVGGDSYRSNCTFELGAYVPAAGKGLIAGGKVHAQPNPSRSGSTSIRFSLGSAATVLVEVFDISGRKVFSFRGDGSLSENSVTWPHAGMAPGTYVVRVEAEAGGRKDVAFCAASVLN